MPIMYLPILFRSFDSRQAGAEALRLAQRQTTTLCPVIEVASVRCERCGWQLLYNPYATKSVSLACRALFRFRKRVALFRLRPELQRLWRLRVSAISAAVSV